MSALLSALAVMVTGCNAVSPQPTASGTSSAVLLPLTARLDQFRDNYSRQIIELQVSNGGPSTLTVVGAAVSSGSFSGPIEWVPGLAATEIPPGQTKSLPAQLPPPVCSGGSSPPTLDVRVLGHDAPVVIPVADPFGVLDRNSREMCLGQDVAGVARLELAPELEPGPSPGTATLRLLVLPKGTAGSLVIDSFRGTPLLAEDPAVPWPKDVRVSGQDPENELRLTVRPARCDPHAVADDKLGTLIPAQITVGGRRGTVRIAAGESLRGQLHDFVTAACEDSRLGP